MPFICIGPVCIPWTVFLPIVMYIGRPIWNRLPPEAQKTIKARWDRFQDWMQVNVWDKMGWKAKAEKKKAPTSAPPGEGDPLLSGDGTKSLRKKLGSVVGLHTESEWETALQLTAESELAGSGVCEHGRRRSACKECDAGGICEQVSRPCLAAATMPTMIYTTLPLQSSSILLPFGVDPAKRSAA